MARRRSACTEAKRDIDVIARLRHSPTQLCCRLIEAVHLEADVMDATPTLSALRTREGVVLEAEDGDIDVVIGEILAGVTLVLQFLHHLQPEALNV